MPLGNLSRKGDAEIKTTTSFTRCQQCWKRELRKKHDVLTKKFLYFCTKSLSKTTKLEGKHRIV